MERNDPLRQHLQNLLEWEDAHAGFERAIRNFPPDLCGVKPAGLPYSAWQILEHLRLCQFDILDFCINPKYVEPDFDALWPKRHEPPNKEAWNASVDKIRKDRDSLKSLAADPDIDLLAKIPHGSGQTYLRELLLVADHNAYHVAELVSIRRILGIWS